MSSLPDIKYKCPKCGVEYNEGTQMALGLGGPSEGFGYGCTNCGAVSSPKAIMSATSTASTAPASAMSPANDTSRPQVAGHGGSGDWDALRVAALVVGGILALWSAYFLVRNLSLWGLIRGQIAFLWDVIRYPEILRYLGSSGYLSLAAMIACPLIAAALAKRRNRSGPAWAALTFQYPFTLAILAVLPVPAATGSRKGRMKQHEGEGVMSEDGQDAVRGSQLGPDPADATELLAPAAPRRRGIWRFWWFGVVTIWLSSFPLVRQWLGSWEMSVEMKAILLCCVAVLPLLVLGLRIGFLLDRQWIAPKERYGKRLRRHYGLLVAGSILTGVIAISVEPILDEICFHDRGWPVWNGQVPADPVDVLRSQGVRPLILLAMLVLGVLPGTVAIGAWMFSREHILEAEAQRRAAQVLLMERRGRRVPWNIPATFLMGFYPLAQGFWWGMARVIWGSLWGRVYFLVGIGLVLLHLQVWSGDPDKMVGRMDRDLGSTLNGWLLGLLACVSVHCGLSCYKWRYVFTGRLPPGWDVSELPQDVSKAGPVSLAPRGALRFLPSVRFLHLAAALVLAGGVGAYACLITVDNASNDRYLLTEYCSIYVNQDGLFTFGRGVPLVGVKAATHGGSRDGLAGKVDDLLVGKSHDIRMTGCMVALDTSPSKRGAYLWRVSKSGRVDLDINAALIRAGLAEPTEGHPRQKEFLALKSAATPNAPD